MRKVMDSQYVILPVEDFKLLIRDRLIGVAAMNGLNRIEAPRESLDRAKQDLANLWKVYDKSITDFEKLVEHHTEEAMRLYKEKLLKEEGVEDSEYELYCK